MSHKNKKNVDCLIIGDPHFKHTNLDEMWEFSKKTIELAEKLSPTFIVILGDTLDTHEIIRIEPRDAAEEWIDCLSSIAKVYLIIGNHDMANPKEFMTKKHAFKSLKKWKSSIDGRICIVDVPIYEEIKDKSFAFCPYVPKGMFKDALDLLLKQGETWEMVDCIFAHQEFKGGHQGAYEITDGDEWDEDYPPVINGHYHNEEIIGKNIFIPGTPIQHSFGDSPDKKVWLVTFDDDETNTLPFKVKKYDLGIKSKKTISIHIDDINNFKLSQTKKYNIKLKIKGVQEQILVFKNTDLYKKLQSTKDLVLEFINADVCLDVESDKEDGGDNDLTPYLNTACRDQVSYLSILQKVVDKKTDPVKEVYREIVGHVEEEVVYDIVFESDEEFSE